MARPQFCVTPGLVVLASLVALSCLRSTKADVGVVSAAAAGAVHVSTGRALVEALMNDAARVIVLDQDVRFETSDWPQQPYTLAHNVTVTSDRNGPHRVIDFNAREVTNRLLIAPGVNMSLIHVTLKDTRYGAGADLDILAPGSGGLIYFHDLAKLQTSCPPLIEANVLAYQRDPLVPGVNNVTFPKVVVWDGVTYYDNILYSNFSTRVAGGENQPGSGYTVQKWGSYKLCKSVPGPACVAANDVSTCVKMEQDADYFANHYVPPPRSGLSPAAKGGIGAAAGVVVALATAAAALALARHRRRAAARRVGGGEVVKGLDLSDVESGFGSGLGSDGVARKGRLGQHASGATTGGVVHVLCPTNPSPSSSGGALQGGPGSGSSQLDRPGGGSRSSVSSQLPDVLSGSLTREEASAVQLGTLVGAGSFGRVFRGHFGDAEVAIKVIHHNRQAAVRVANEVQLMMGFDFENVVKAHHFVTWGAAGVSRPEGNGVADARHISFNGSFTVPFFDVASSSGGNSLVASGNGSGGTSAAAASKRMVETWILQEYCDGGTLQDAVFEKGSGAFFNTQMVPQMGVMLHMLLGVARGMEWLHARNVLHGDLKAANVLLKSPDGGRGAAASFSGSHSGAASQRLGGGPGAAEAARAAVAESVMAMVPKVADFGLSRIMGEGATHLSTHTLGTITHQCPELIRTGRLSKPADAFSFGVVMWEVIMAANPWGGKMMGEIVTAVMEGRRLTFGPAAPQAYVELAKDCMRGVSERRPTFDQIVARLQAMLGQQDELQAEAEAGAANAAAAAAAQETPVAEDGWRRVA